MNRPTTLLACAAALALGVATPAAAQDFFYVGAPGGDFFDESNWNDAADGTGNPLAGDPLIDDDGNAIGVDLVIDGDTVVANGQVDFGIGSLTLLPGSSFSVTGSGNDLDINDDSTLSATGATIDVDDFAQLGGVVSLTGSSTLTASDDINFFGTVTIADSMIESTGDDIEFRSESTVVSITGSDFLASATGSGGGLNQVIYFRTSTNDIFDSTFRAGRFGVITDGPGTTTSVVLNDSTVNVDGDIDPIFASSDGGVHQLTLAGDSVLIADQLETVALFVQDGSSATFTDESDGIPDDDGDSWLTDNALVRLDSFEASVTFETDQTADTRSRVFDGVNGTTYALSPGNFSPSDWDGVSGVTLRLVPEPAAATLIGLMLAMAAARRRLV